jgi:hypothetical protein
MLRYDRVLDVLITNSNCVFRIAVGDAKFSHYFECIVGPLCYILSEGKSIFLPV